MIPKVLPFGSWNLFRQHALRANYLPFAVKGLRRFEEGHPSRLADETRRVWPLALVAIGLMAASYAVYRYRNHLNTSRLHSL